MSPLQIAVRTILEQPLAYEWSVQGFGLLRLYMRNDARLHIWDKRLRYQNVSMIHNHSWWLHSTVVVGELRNRRYVRTGLGDDTAMWCKRLVTGYSTRDVSEPKLVLMRALDVEFYRPGDAYLQAPNVVHETDADDSTVTLMKRNETEGDGQADVYWPADGKWGTAKPRPASTDEILMVTRSVLEKHFA